MRPILNSSAIRSTTTFWTKGPFDEQSDVLVHAILSDVLTGGNRRTVPNSGGGWSWTNLRRMNTLLEYADMCEDKEAVTKYTAVTRFFRAFFLFRRKYAVSATYPGTTSSSGSADELLYKPRDSRELILTKMLEDIDYAINSGGLTEEISPFRVNKWAALALKSRFCLFEGTYRKYHNLNLEGNDANYYLDLAAKAAKEIIEKGPTSSIPQGNPDRTI